MSEQDNRIKILFLLTAHVFGGAERTSLNLLKGIDKKRFKICLITSRTISGYFQNIGIEKLISIEDLKLGVWFGSVIKFIGDVRKVARLLKQERPDIAFGMMHYPSALLVSAQKLSRINSCVIASPRGPSSEYLRHFEHIFLRRACLKWLFTFFCRGAGGVVVSSEGMKEECIRDYRSIPEKITVIPNSIDVDSIKEKNKEGTDIAIPSGSKVIVTSGRLEKEKNTAFLLKVFPGLRKREQIKLMIVGDGRERKALEKLSRELNISDDVIFTGYQNNPYKYIKRADIFVHTCLFEGFANVIIEAMACGVPVISVDCPYGPRDIVQHGKNGLLVKMGDEETLRDTILRLLHDRQLRNSLAVSGLERALDFSVHKMVRRYESFFNRVQGSQYV
jgi:glycosyltransferase involved in cell wall biosynthesis